MFLTTIISTDIYYLSCIPFNMTEYLGNLFKTNCPLHILCLQQQKKSCNSIWKHISWFVHFFSYFIYQLKLYLHLKYKTKAKQN